MIKLRAILYFLFIDVPFFITGGLELIILLNHRVIGHCYETKKLKLKDKKQKAINYLEKLYKK